MLSEARHLPYLPGNTQIQALPFAQDDNPGDFFRSLLIKYGSRGGSLAAFTGFAVRHEFLGQA